MSVAFDPERFIAAQEPVWARVTAELAAGHKRSHWMWFIFPQIAGLGMSATSVRYALPSLAAAEAYLAHPVLGPRLIEAVELMLRHRDKSAETILGGIDAVKFRSCLTLFDAVAGSPPPFADALDAFYAGVRDSETLKRI
jgi:uncharacterized protein (DUF1810 family)